MLLSEFLRGDLRSIALPLAFPKTVAVPKYPVGARCGWIPTPQTDWGTVIGQVYAPHLTDAQSAPQWSWLYLLLLDPDSPSRGWIAADLVSEEDLELLAPEQPQPTVQPNQEAE